MSIVGFTGTSKGLTETQERSLKHLLCELWFGEFHHGDCVGADATAHKLVSEGPARIHVHPPKNPRARAFCKGHVMHPEKDYLVRNKDICNAADILIATPKEFDEQLRSGTWSTVRYMRRLGKPVWMVYPDGRRNLI